MPKIIITRHCHGGLTAITNCVDPDEPNPPIMEFNEYSEAMEVAEKNPLCKTFGYTVLDVEI